MLSLSKKYEHDPIVALPVGSFSHGGEYVVDECPNPTCRKRKTMSINVEKGKGFCYRCELKIFGQRGINKHWPELTGKKTQVKSLFNLSPVVALADPARFGMHAWDNEDSKWWLIEKCVTEEVSRQIPIYWVPSEYVMACVMDSLSPDYPPATWIRDIKKGKWRPVAGTASAYYSFGLRHLKPEKDLLVVVEGMSDIIQTGMLGNAVAILGTKASPVFLQQLHNRQYTTVVLWLDADVEGDKGTLKLALKMLQWGLPVRVLRTKKHPKLYENGMQIVRNAMQGDRVEIRVDDLTPVFDKLFPMCHNKL